MCITKKHQINDDDDDDEQFNKHWVKAYIVASRYNEVSAINRSKQSVELSCYAKHMQNTVTQYTEWSKKTATNL